MIVTRSSQATAGLLMRSTVRSVVLHLKHIYPNLVINLEDDGGFLSRSYLITIRGESDIVGQAEETLRGYGDYEHLCDQCDCDSR